MMGRVLIKLGAVALIAALSFTWGARVGSIVGHRWKDYEAYDTAQLSNIAEGLREQISQLEDELETVQRLQREKMAAE